MQITINGSIAFGPSWDALQTLIQSMVTDEHGVITRIARRDGGANYRHRSGIYDLTFRTRSEEIPVTLLINTGA